MASRSIKRANKGSKDEAPPIELVVNENENKDGNTTIKSPAGLLDKEQQTSKAIKCICCGKAKYEESFYMNKTSVLFSGVYGRVPICKDCLDKIGRSYALQYEPLAAAAALCAIVDLPFVESMAYTIIEDGKFQLGQYMRMQNLPGIKDKNFIFSIINGDFFNAKEKLNVEVEKLWSRQDKQNKRFVIEKYGYDPFESFGLEDADYRAAFNITAAYLEDESIVQDAHKMQSLVTMVETIIQSNKVDALLTRHYKNIKPDSGEIKTLTATKKDLQTTISKLAEDNNISSKYQKDNRASQNYLTSKMKEMANVEYWEAKPNMFDVRTSAAMRQVLDMSHQSILEQLELTDSDYADMVKEQREMIKNLTEKCDRLEEENRNLTNQLISVTQEGGE